MIVCVFVRACVRSFLRVCMRACVRACVCTCGHACVRVCVFECVQASREPASLCACASVGACVFRCASHKEMLVTPKYENNMKLFPGYIMFYKQRQLVSRKPLRTVL